MIAHLADHLTYEKVEVEDGSPRRVCLDPPEFEVPVAVIGSGPAGLAAACELKRQGLVSLVLEAGDRVGHSFHNMPKNFKLGPWMNDLLPYSKVSWRYMLAQPRCREYGLYLEEYARQHELVVQTMAPVTRVEHGPEGFRVFSKAGVVHAQAVVNATGYYRKPHLPEYPGECSIPRIHAADYEEPEQLAHICGGRGRILVVGKRVTAGELMLELHDAGFELGLSHRGKLIFGPSPLMQVVNAPVVLLAESVMARMGVKFNSYPRMAGGRTKGLIRGGVVPTFPEIESWHGRGIRFVDGRQEEFDGVLYCTGFELAIDHLQSLVGDNPRIVKGESASVPGLFFAGVDRQFSVRSRYLRGIRQDAGKVAKAVKARLEAGSSE